MKIYLAATYSRNAEMRGIRDQLEALGHEVTSRWIDQHGGNVPESIVAEKLNASPVECYPYAEADVTDLKVADTVILFTSADGGGQGGRHVEFGLAIGLGKRLIIVGPRENVFHTLPQVEWYPDPASLLAAWSEPAIDMGYLSLPADLQEALKSGEPEDECEGAPDSEEGTPDEG
jgi:hypothetical protein